MQVLKSASTCLGMLKRFFILPNILILYFYHTQQKHNLLSERFKPVCHSKKSTLQHLLDGVEKQCDEILKEFDESSERMRLAGLQYANG